MKKIIFIILAGCSIAANAQRGCPEAPLVKSDTTPANYKVATCSWVMAHAGSSLVDDILHFSTNKYTLFPSEASGRLFTYAGTLPVNHSVSAAYGGNWGAWSLFATNSFSIGMYPGNMVTMDLTTLSLTQFPSGNPGYALCPNCTGNAYIKNTWTTVAAGTPFDVTWNNMVPVHQIFGNGDTKITGAFFSNKEHLYKYSGSLTGDSGAVVRNNTELVYVDDTLKAQIAVPSAYGEVYKIPDSTFSIAASAGTQDYYLGSATKWTTQVIAGHRYITENVNDGGLGATMKAISGGDGVYYVKYDVSIKDVTAIGSTISITCLKTGALGTSYQTQIWSQVDISVAESNSYRTMSGNGLVKMSTNDKIYLLLEIISGNTSTIYIKSCTFTMFRVHR